MAAPADHGLVARPGARRRAALRLGGSIHSVATSEPLLAVTFDDGPDPQHTPGILDALAHHGATATFFLLVDRAEANPALVRRLVTDGHEVGLHGDVHQRLTDRPLTEVARALRRSRRTLERLAGRPVRLVRPPFGSQSRATFALARASGLHVVWWSAVAMDWERRSIDEMADRAAARLRPGEILLLHEDFVPDPREPQPAPDHDRAVLVDRILTLASDRGLRGVSVGELLATGEPRLRLWFQG